MRGTLVRRASERAFITRFYCPESRGWLARIRIRCLSCADVRLYRLPRLSMLTRFYYYEATKFDTRGLYAGTFLRLTSSPAPAWDEKWKPLGLFKITRRGLGSRFFFNQPIKRNKGELLGIVSVNFCTGWSHSCRPNSSVKTVNDRNY